MGNGRRSRPLHGLRSVRRRVSRRKQHSDRGRRIRPRAAAPCTGFASSATGKANFPNAQLRFQPVLCQQCDEAPCEPVCPTYASYHTAEGLNAQVYNRCIGTRFCANACPYNVRFFNFFNPEWEKPLHLQLNPDVSVRSVGVMEKCTFCVQRIKAAEIQAEAEKRELKDGEFKPACVQSCPAKALVFGDLNDPESEVSRLSSSARGTKLLGELGTQPNVTYLERGSLAGCKKRLNKSSRTCCGRSFTAARGYWVAVALAGSLVLAGVARSAIRSMHGHRRLGSQLAGLLGLRHHELRLLDRHQPRRHADLRDSASGQCHLAAPGHALRRGHHRLRADHRRDLPDLPPRPAVALLLADSVSERAPDLAELPLAAGLGLLRHLHLPHRQPTFLFLPMIPDFAVVRDATTGLRKKIYGVLALGWQGTPSQWHRLEIAMQIMAIAIIPVAVSVHTIVSCDFAMTPVPMWHSTIFGPYFVVGAIFSGIAALIMAMALLRKFLHLEEYLQPMHFENLGKLLLTMSLLWFYFTFAERLTTWYGNDPSEMAVFWATHPASIRAALLDDGGLQLHHSRSDPGHQEAAHHHRLRHRVLRHRRRHVARALPDHRAVARAQVPALLVGTSTAPPGWKSR